MRRVNFISSRDDCSAELEGFINGLSDHTTVVLKGGCYLSRKVRVRNKKGLAIVGEDAKIITAFDPKEGFYKYSGAFDFEGCENLTIQNLIFDTDKPVNSAGRVVSVESDDSSFVVKMLDGCALDGGQTIFAMNSMDGDGSPDYILASYEKSPYEVLENGEVRVFGSENLRKSIAKLPIGERICFRFGLGNFHYLKNSAITFENCKNVSILDITVHSSAGYMIVAFPRCENFRIERYRVECPKGSNRLMASNIDGIHLLGVGGTVTMKDCFFDGLGDDALNIHSTAGFITESDGGSIKVINKRFDIPMDKSWCRKGDIIAVYDTSFVRKGSLMVEKFEDSRVYYSVCEGSAEVGDVVANTFYNAEILVEGCEVRNSRARALLFQTENITVRNCEFFGISLPAILMAPDIVVWHEMSPVKNVLIENCTFRKCGFVGNNEANAVISVKTSHDGSQQTPQQIHSNITVRNNVFKDVRNKAIYMSSVKGFDIENNDFGKDDYSETTVLQNCK
ncbi:MAG: right-handed parallel beta-helix repeat-containing protein [Acutalibacteraceae bacterium]